MSVSPFDTLEALASLKPITLAPSLLAAVSKLRRVRVEGSKKRVANRVFSLSVAVSYAALMFFISISIIAYFEGCFDVFVSFVSDFADDVSVAG